DCGAPGVEVPGGPDLRRLRRRVLRWPLGPASLRCAVPDARLPSPPAGTARARRRGGRCPVSGLTPRQRSILRAYGGWMRADILSEPDRGIAHAKQSRCGTTNYRVDGEEFWMQTTARGIELSRPTGYDAEPCEVLPWSAVA